MGTADRRQRESRQRRQQILAAARKLFWKQGYQRTTIPGIAAQAELAPGTIYLYFESKSSLYAALLEEGYELLQRRLAGALAGELSPVRRAEAMIDAFLGFAHERPEYFDIIFFVFQRERAEWDDALPAESMRRLTERQDICKALVAQAIADSRLAPDSSGKTVDAVWSMLGGVVFFFNGRESFQAVAAEARLLLLAAFFGKAGR